MENLYSRIRQSKIAGKLPKKHEINLALSAFSKKEWIIFTFLLVVFLFSTISILESINKHYMVDVPARGGNIAEGIIGTPRFVNPILANSPADLDLVSLVYSGLMRKSPDGTLIPDLAEKVEMLENGLNYTFTLKDNIYFHDGKPVTVEDIIFTISKIKDPVTKSVRKVNWEGVSVEKVDEKTLKFNLKQPYASFLENTVLGIMPASLWENSPIELNNANTNPIGSGPYMIYDESRQSSGLINAYELKAFKKFALGEPYIKNITFRFYLNEEALMVAFLNKEIDQISSITPTNAEILKEKKHKIASAVLPRVFGLFFNQNQNQLFVDKSVISAINQVINKDRIIEEVLSGYGVAIDDPIPPGMIQYQKLTGTEGTPREEVLEKAKATLTKAGWKIGEDGFLEKTITEKKKKITSRLEFSISTGNAPELAETAELIKEDLLAIGMKVDIKTFEIGNLNQNVIRPRKYDALLFGQIINHESDLFAFWHSSQRKDPGLNVAMYTNVKVDKILEEAPSIIDETDRTKKYAQFESEIKKDMPVAFLYSPDFIYITSSKLKGFSMGNIITPGDRFSNIHLWYINTDGVWKIFAR